MDTKVIKSLLLLMMGSVFLSIGYFYYHDNYSIEQLIQTFQLYGGDSLTYKIKVNQAGDSKECVIKGGFNNNILSIESVKDRRSSDSYKDDKVHQNCNEIKENTSFGFIGDFEKGSLTKKVDIDYATL